MSICPGCGSSSRPSTSGSATRANCRSNSGALQFGSAWSTILDLDDDVGRRASGRLHPVEDSRPKGRVRCEDGFETSARFARWRHNRQLDSIERKHARPAAGWLDPLLRPPPESRARFRAAHACEIGPKPFAASSSFAAIVDSSRRALPRTSMSAHFSRPARDAASTISPAAGAALRPP